MCGSSQILAELDYHARNLSIRGKLGSSCAAAARLYNSSLKSCPQKETYSRAAAKIEKVLQFLVSKIHSDRRLRIATFRSRT